MLSPTCLTYDSRRGHKLQQITLSLSLLIRDYLYASFRFRSLYYSIKRIINEIEIGMNNIQEDKKDVL